MAQTAEKPEITTTKSSSASLLEDGEMRSKEREEMELEKPIGGDQKVDYREQISRKYAKKAHGFDADEEDEDDDPEKTKPLDDKPGDDKPGETPPPEPEKQPTEPKDRDNKGDKVAKSGKTDNTDDNETVEVKINGIARQVPKSKIDAAGGLKLYQKEVAANEKLSQAAKERQQLERDRQEFEQEKQQFAQSRQGQPQPPTQGAVRPDLPTTGDQPETLASAAKAYREALYADKSEDEVDNALINVIRAAQSTSATEAELTESIGKKAAKIVVSELNAHGYETQRQAAVIAFETDYPEIAGDPHLRKMAHNESGRVIAEHPDWGPDRVIEEAAKRTQKWLNDLRGSGQESSDPPPDPPPPPASNTLAQRTAEKRALQKPVAGNAKGTQPDTGRKVQSRSEYIHGLRVSRGLEAPD